MNFLNKIEKIIIPRIQVLNRIFVIYFDFFVIFSFTIGRKFRLIVPELGGKGTKSLTT